MENEKKKSFGEFITQRRRALGMTQREFADKLFVTDSAVSKWERGEAMPDATKLAPLASALGVSIDWLLSEDEPQFASESEDGRGDVFNRRFRLLRRPRH